MPKDEEQREFWKEFIGVYRGLPDLWKVKSDGYKDRNKKDPAYKLLVEKMKEIDPNANRASVRAKINSFRAAYRRELKKVKTSKKSGEGTDNVYVSTWWYFDELDFLRDQETQIPGTSSMDETIEEIDEMDDTVVEDSSEVHQLQRTPICKRPKKNEPRSGSKEKRGKVLALGCERLENPSSDAQIIAKGWAVEFGKMSANQQLFAKKFIDEILFEGRLGNLHRHAITINHCSPQPFATPHTQQLIPPPGYFPVSHTALPTPFISYPMAPSSSYTSTRSVSSQYMRTPRNVDQSDQTQPLPTSSTVQDLNDQHSN